MKIVVVTQCTAGKSPLPCPAEKMYKGLHHTRIMAGVKAARDRGDEVSLWIVSAYYGLIPGDLPITPYNISFSTMRPAERSATFKRLGIDLAIPAVLRRYDAAVIALGENYVGSIDFSKIEYPAPTVRIAARPSTSRNPIYAEIPGGMPECKTFSSGIISLKGEIAGRILTRDVYRDRAAFLGLVDDLGPIL